MVVKRLFSLFIVMCIAGTISAQTQAKGSAMPDFTFFKLDDKPFPRAQVIKDTKSLFMYFDPSCEHCQAEIMSIGKKYTEFKNVTFYLISSSEKAQIGKFMDTYGKLVKGKKNVTVLYDRDMQYIVRFIPTQYPDINVYTAQGKLVKHFSGTTNINDIIKAVNEG